MTEGHEIIDGKRFWVKRDDDGVVFSSVADDIIPPPKPPHPIVGRARAIVRAYRPTERLSQKDRDELLVFLTRSALRELRDD